MSGEQDDLQELVNDFVTESREHLRTVEADLLRLEEGGSDAATVNNVFRCVHSVKGVAGFLGLERIQSLAHTLESTLDLVRKERLQPTPDLVGALLAAIDGLRALIENVGESNQADIQIHTQALQPFLEPGNGPQKAAAAPQPAVPPPPAPTPPPAPMPVAREQEAHPAAAPEPADTASAQPAKATAAVDKPAAPKAEGEPAATGAESIRVSVDLLNRLMNLSGEMVLGRNQVLQAIGPRSEKPLHTATMHLSQVVSEMQEAIMQTRLQPVGNVLQRFPRVVRDLCGKLGKRCRLMLEGKEVELDRSILEALGDPLTHLVRNAIDHGIEKPDLRQQRNKPAEGTLTLQAFHQGGNVKIEIRDDGAGIDPERLRRKAVEKGVITAEQARSLSDRDATLLIFAPGFSTAEKLTDVSGRGVGMDVVRSNIEKIGGHVEVHSTVGVGTTMTITIPLTLAIMPALVVTCDDRRYVLPQNNVTELVRIRSADRERRILQVNGREVLRLRGRMLPVVHLRDALALPDNPADRSARTYNIMVVQSGALQYGLVVDSPPDTEEIVVKPLGSHLKGRAEYSGSTILGDGRVALILDVVGLANTVKLRAQEHSDEEVLRTRTAAGNDEETNDFVLFRNHESELFAVPLGLVSRIQRLDRKEIASVGGELVHENEQRAMPIVTLERHVEAKAGPELGDRTSVLVLRVQSHEFGLVAPRVEDIRSLTVRVDDRTLKRPGVMGSFQLEGHTVRLLDIATIANKALPQLFVDVPTKVEPPKSNRKTRLLFAEDSNFFRRHVANILTEAGFDVVACEDGDIAWKTLQSDTVGFDVVVTDIQMPNCDGLELTKRIRRDERTAKLPILALTSLSRQEDIDLGRAAGITDYRIKLDDAALIAAIRELAGAKA